MGKLETTTTSAAAASVAATTSSTANDVEVEEKQQPPTTTTIPVADDLKLKMSPETVSNTTTGNNNCDDDEIQKIPPNPNDTIDPPSSQWQLPPEMMPQALPAPPPPSQPSQPGAYAQAGPARFARPPAVITNSFNRNAAPPPVHERSTDLLLTEAVAVGEDDDDEDVSVIIGGTAQPVNRRVQREKRRKRRQERRQFRKYLWVALGVVIVAAFLTIGIRIYRGTQNLNITTTTTTTTESPTTAPTIAIALTNPPTGILYDFVATLPNATIYDLLDPFSAPTAAYYWLEDHPDVLQMTLTRQTQLFALATLYHACLEENGPDYIINSWLEYSRHECLWFSSQDLLLSTTTRLPICNDQGDYIRLDFGNNEKSMLNFSSSVMKLPREIQLLSHLQDMVWRDANIPTMSLEEFLPSELFQMTNLETIALDGNRFTGTLSTQFGRMRNLRVLDVSRNDLTGSIPTEWGQLPNLQSLSLSHNQLSGTVPQGWNNLTYLNLQGNPLLSGILPNELCALREEDCQRTLDNGCQLEWDCSERLCGCDCPCGGN